MASQLFITKEIEEWQKNTTNSYHIKLAKIIQIQTTEKVMSSWTTSQMDCECGKHAKTLDLQYHEQLGNRTEHQGTFPYAYVIWNARDQNTVNNNFVTYATKSVVFVQSRAEPCRGGVNLGRWLDWTMLKIRHWLCSVLVSTACRLSFGNIISVDKGIKLLLLCTCCLGQQSNFVFNYLRFDE